MNPHIYRIVHSFDLIYYLQLSGVTMNSGSYQVSPTIIYLEVDMYAFHQFHTTLPNNYYIIYSIINQLDKKYL